MKKNKLDESKTFLKLSNNEKIYPGKVKRTISGEFTIQKFDTGYEIASKTSIINHLINFYNYKSYLEIGIRDGRNFNKINIKNKIAIDPKPLINNEFIYHLTSDQFFENNTTKFDIIFIDGLHLEKQVDKDINNSLNCLNVNGTIVMHDCNPPTEFHQRENYKVNGKFPPWNGTTWRSYTKLRMKKKNLEMYCIDCDWGVGIIRNGSQTLFRFNEKLSYKILEKERKKILNLISVKDFLNKFSKKN